MRRILQKFFSRDTVSATTSQDDTQGFGTISGVYIPSILMMFGVILFLRLGLITSYLGPFKMAGVILLSLTVMLITAASITAIVTNMDVKSGGIYYLISRSLGIEIGGAIGILLYLCQIISISLCTTGFAISFCEVFPYYSRESVEIVTLLLLTTLSFFSTDLALKMQSLILVLLVASIGSIFFGSYTGIAVHQTKPFFADGLTFWEGFSLFYPALTGIEAGMALSGTLKNPSRSLSLGTFAALLTSGSVYMIVSLFLYFSINTADLQNDPLVILQFGPIPQLITAGIWGATLSSVLASIMGAPRMLQAIADDGITVEIFARTYGKNKEPRYAIGLTFLIALVLMLFTTIDQIIPILTMICLISYGTLNLVTGFAELINAPHWRPLTRTHWAVSFLGAALCFSFMLLVDVTWTFIAIFVVLGIYFVLKRQKIHTSFEDFRQSIIFFFSRLALYKLSDSPEHPTHWHPQLMAFFGSPKPQEKLIHLCHSLTHQSGILTFATIVPPSLMAEETLQTRKKALEDHYLRQGINCLVELTSNESIDDGMESMIKSYGIGPFQPNTIVLPVEDTCPIETVQLSQMYNKNILLFRENTSVPEKAFTSRYKAVSKRIDVWWDMEESYSFELTISFTIALAESILWRGSKLHLHASYSEKEAKENIFENMKSFLTNSRLKMKPHIHEDQSDLFTKYAKEADIVFIPLRPISSFESENAFVAYFNGLLDQTKYLRSVAFVLSQDLVNHREIYDY